MKKWIQKILLLITVGYLTICVALYFFQDQLLYFPTQPSFDQKLNTLVLNTDVGNTLVTQQLKSGDKAIIYFGGNAEDVRANLPVFERIFADYSVFLMHYRGYSGSDGSPSEQALYQDALALYQRLAKDYNTIVIMGRSLGSGVATWLAARQPASKLILVTPYSSIEEIASDRFWWLPVSWIIKDKYLSWKNAENFRSEVFVLIAEHDQVIPMSSTLKLVNSFDQDIVKTHVIKGVGHNSISSNPEYLQLLKDIVK